MATTASLWDITNKCYVGTISLGTDPSGKRIRRTVTGKTKAQVKAKLDKLHDEIKAGIRSPATYTVEQCVRDWLDSLTIDDETIAQYRGQAEKWIYPKIGKAKLKTLSAKDVERLFNDCARVLSKRSLVGLKSTLRRSIRRAQRHDLIGRNVADLTDLPEGQPGRPSRAMTEHQAATVLSAATGQADRLRLRRQGRQATARPPPTPPPRPASWPAAPRPRKNATIQHISTDLADATCHHCRNQLGLDGTSATAGWRRCSSWPSPSACDPANSGRSPGITSTWTRGSSTSGARRRKGGDTKTPQSRRSLVLPKRAVDALTAHKKRQAAERLAGRRGLARPQPRVLPRGRPPVHARRARLAVRCGHPPAGIGHWHAHEGRHTAVSIMSSNGVPIQDISDTVGHKSTHVTETVYRHVIVPAIRGGATIMDDVFGTASGA